MLWPVIDACNWYVAPVGTPALVNVGVLAVTWLTRTKCNPVAVAVKLTDASRLFNVGLPGSEALSSFEESWFYSDSRNDLPLLCAVTHPVVVDPDRELEALAARERWPILRIHSAP